MNETTTGPTVRDVDAAVRSVLSDMTYAARANGTPTRADDVFAGRLLSLRQVEALPAGLREVKVAPGTVITPLARDLLKRLGVGIAFVARSEAQSSGQEGTWGFAIESGSGVVEAFRRSLLDSGGPWQDLGRSAVIAALWVAEATSRGALVLTDEASIAVYRACQVEGVRAASAGDADATARAVRALGVNLLVVEPAGKPIALLKQIGATFRRASGPVCPAWMETTQGGRAS